MANTVFANGLEVSCKISGGNSVAAFPDPCWSPPSPPAGPVVIPYANTAYAKDLANGTTSVLIGGKPVARKDQSYLSTSTGNEAATRSFAQGVTTGTIKGKAYYTSWSMNVMVEGLNVPRHTDLMTHNHGSQPGNTGGWAYVSKADKTDDCRKDIERVEKKCGVDEKENKKFRDKQKRRNKLRLKRGKNEKEIRNLTWKDKHCKALAIKPGIESLKKAEKDFKAELNAAKNDFWDVSEKATKELMTNAAESYTTRSITRYLEGLSCTILGPEATVACETAATLHNIVDSACTVVSTGYDLWEKRDIAKELMGKVGEIKGYLSKIKDMRDVLTGDKKEQAYKDIVEKLKDVANDMSIAATADPCTRAKRCQLVPYKNLGKQGRAGNTTKAKNSSLFGMMFGDQRGCCSGQTGHHLVPDAWAKNGCDASKYNENAAPVVCVEGVSHSIGSHGTIHDALDDIVIDFYEKNKEEATVSINKAINMASDAHRNSFGLISDCNEQCIKAQLRSYYKNCGCGQLKPSTKSEENTGVPDYQESGGER
ncbi:hypothetical protein VA7868_03564 [Vibrio aerogenes CECT 7868]|uniref:Tox-GHH2 domain-containing protein n=1 Tax=Vibrio aerogenes CECT 7868 TaxID=1216006 RepID=A0A1M6AG73_9VIBR|nr:PAAR-like domain-containing protein [Vibrio aerogenes]SHI35223.1 hypothetical protein VA7868_03564 [Vibrio aerogenes CECT 7868]